MLSAGELLTFQPGMTASIARCLLTASVLASLGVGGAWDVCGNYCGPTWCDADATPECAAVSGSACTPSNRSCTEQGPTDGSCADSCCRAHDACCGSSDRRPCNKQILACLESCLSDEGPSCMHGVMPVPVAVVIAGMELDPYACCGTSCDEGAARAAGATTPNATELRAQ